MAAEDGTTALGVAVSAFAFAYTEDNSGNQSSLQDTVAETSSFDTIQLIQLRLLVTTTDEDTKTKLALVLGLEDAVTHAFVATARKYRVAPDDAHKFDCMKEVWLQCRSLDEAHALHIPPIYDKKVATLLTTIFKGIRLREDFPGEAFQYGHAGIYGVEGTGKSTIMKAFAVAVAVCCTNFFFIYADYMCTEALDWTPQRLLYELVLRFNSPFLPGRFGRIALHCPIGLSPLLQTLRHRFHVQPGLIADGIHEIVKTTKDRADKNARARIMFGIHEFAREYRGTYVIMTSSCTTVWECLFYNDRRDGYDHFPNFNKSLFNLYSISALRDAESLGQYYKERYGVNVDHHTIETMLFGTGGNGSVLHACWREGMVRLHPPPPCTSDDWLIPRLRSVDPMSCFKDINDSFIFVPTLIRVYQLSCSNDLVAKMKSGVPLVPADVSIPLYTLLSTTPILSKHKIKDWTKQGLLYIDDDAAYQKVVLLARPCDSRLYFEEGTDAKDFMRLVFVRTVVYDTGKALPDADYQLQTLMRPRLWFAPRPSAPAQRNVIRIRDGLLRFSVDDGVTFTLLTEVNIRMLEGKTWHWRSEIGHDAFQFEVADSLVIVWSWQCKVGRLRDTVGGGDAKTAIVQLLASAGERMNDLIDLTENLVHEDPEAATTTPSPATRDFPPLRVPADVGGYQAKAAVGLCFMMAAILRSLPSPWRVEVKEFRLAISKQDTTTKAAAQQAEDDCEVSDELALATGFPADLLSRWNTPRRLNTKLDLGDSWIRTGLEPSLRGYWPAPPPP